MDYSDGTKKQLKASDIIQSISVRCDDEHLLNKHDAFDSSHFMKATVKLKALTTNEISKWTQDPIDSERKKKANDDKTPKVHQTRSKKINSNNDDELPRAIKRKCNTLTNSSASKRPKVCPDDATKPKPCTNDVKTVSIIPFKVDEVIWGKIRGWPHWPCKILSIDTVQQRYNVFWFNDYRTTNLYKSQVFKFYPNFDIFAEKFSSTVGLKDAAKEAMLYIREQKKIH